MKKLISFLLIVTLAIAMLALTACESLPEASGSGSDTDVSEELDSNGDSEQASKGQSANKTDSKKSSGNKSSANKTSSNKSSANKTSSKKTSSKKTSSNKSSNKSSNGSNAPIATDSRDFSTTNPDPGNITPVEDYPELPKDMTKGGTYPTEKSGDIFVSTTGNDSAAGTKNAPLKTLTAAVNKATAGTTIFMMPGVYPNSTRINLVKSGTASAPITIQAYEWGNVVIDFTNQLYGKNDANYCGFMLKGNYWHIQGLEICHAGDNGIKVEGSYNYMGRLVTHHNGDSGIQLGFGHDTNKNNPGNLCAYNTIENCDSYLNYDFDNWGDADGFACKMHNGKNNVFIGCRAWKNCDDAWDLYETNYSVYIVNSWAWESGIVSDFSNDKYFSDPNYLAKKSGIMTLKKPAQTGNGNGIKMGGNGSGGSSEGVHYAINCVAFGNDKGNSVKGFDENNHTKGVVIRNCVAWGNGYNYMYENAANPSSFTNNLSMYLKIHGSQSKCNTRPGEIGNPSAVLKNNNFYSDGGDLQYDKSLPTLTEADFVTIDPADAAAPRESDGSLPNNGFAQLKSSSPYYGKGMGLLKR